MMVVDKVVTWFLQNVIIPRSEIIDKPGFLVTTVSRKNEKAYLRDLLLSEDLFVKIEKAVVQKYGEEGRATLYSIGKKFGYLYASLSDFPQMTKSKESDLLSTMYFFIRYIEGMYASEMKHTADLKTKTLRLYAKDYIVCRKDGIGLIMTDGGMAGVWAWVCDDKSVEGTQIKCQGRGDDQCETICAPIELLKQSSEVNFRELDMPNYFPTKEYKIYNMIRETNYSKNSLRTLLDGRFFDFHKGIMSYKGKRMFIDDTHILFILEAEISKLANGEDILFKTTFEEGKEIIKIAGETNWPKFITDYLSAIGFGDIAVLDSKNPRIGLIYYPWTELSSNSKHTIILGLISGIITQATGKNTKLKVLAVTVRDYLTLTIGV